MNAFISETLEWEAGNRFAPLDVVHYLRTHNRPLHFEPNPRSGATSIKCPQQTRASIFERLSYVQIEDLDLFDLDILAHCKPCAFVYSQGQFPTQLSLHVELPEGPEWGICLPSQSPERSASLGGHCRRSWRFGEDRFSARIRCCFAASAP